MLETFIASIIQSAAEWLPFNSEKISEIVNTRFPESGFTAFMAQQMYFLRLGACLAAAVYFRKDIIAILRGLARFKTQTEETQRLTHFLIVSTVISAALGFALLKTTTAVLDNHFPAGQFITFFTGVLLLITGKIESKFKKDGKRQVKDLTLSDGIILGIIQGCAILPGLSRSGLTIAALLLNRFSKEASLKLSFLMGLPVVLAGNIILNASSGVWTLKAGTGLLISFLFGLVCIHALMILARKIRFGGFLLIFGLITILAAVITG